MNITRKGQVTIPVEIRERHNFLPEAAVELRDEGGRVYLIKSEPLLVKESPFDYVRGKSTSGLSTDDIMKLIRSEE